MKKRLAVLAAAGLLGAFAFAASGSANSTDLVNKYSGTGGNTTYQCGDSSHTVSYVGPAELWPPNHKLASAIITAKGVAGEDVTLSVAGSVDDAVGGDGGTNHDPNVYYSPADQNGGGANMTQPGDESGQTSVGLKIRSERSGSGDGRTYNFSWSASFDGKPCTSEDDGNHPFVVTVPHDQRGGAGWK